MKSKSTELRRREIKDMIQWSQKKSGLSQKKLGLSQKKLGLSQKKLGLSQQKSGLPNKNPDCHKKIWTFSYKKFYLKLCLLNWLII